MNFALFLVLNAILLLRPEELFPEIAGLRLYLITIVACLVTSLPGITARLTPEALKERPIGVCVLGLWAAGFLSHLFYRQRIEDGIDFTGEFGKVVAYYFLFITLVDTPARFKAMVGWLVLCITMSSTLAVLDYHGFVDFEAIEHVQQWETDPETGEAVILPRLVSSGIFNDPNDLCLALTLGMLGCAYMAFSGGGPLRVVWFLPVAPMAYAFTLTHSKGGLIGLAAGIVAMLYARYGGKRSIPLAIAAVVALLVVIGGRQASLGGGGTAHERLMYWARGISDLLNMPMYLVPGLGVGYFSEEMGQVAHNSFVSAYVETGLLGGGFFLGAFYIAARLVERSNRDRDAPAPAYLPAQRIFVFAACAAYAAGAYSLSRQFVLPTYITLGLASAYLELNGRLPDRFRVSNRWFVRLSVISVLGFLALKFMTQGLGVLGV